jgi:gliding motility-associated-like protein
MKQIVIILIFIGNFCFSQSPAGIWYFGNEAGINFNLGTTPVQLLDGKMKTFEGCATLCNDFGTLLFYTDGITVWNRNHDEMPNGTGLFGDSSSTQSAIIVPIPGSTKLYYIFTVDELAKPNGLSYSIVDMNLDNEYGDVITKNVPILTPTLEKINVVKHSNETDYWLISHKFGNNQFYAYKITSTGLNAPVISSVGEIVNGSNQNTLGYLKSSPNGKFIACANSKANSSNLQLFNFDTTTGAISLLSTTSFENDNVGIGIYGVEFSNDSNLLYVTNIDNENKKSQLFQLNIESQNETIINNSQLLLGEFYSDNVFNGTFGALQLAPNKKIYVARNNVNYLGVINSPDIIGTSCSFNPNGFSLGSKSCYYGLPAFITSLFDISYRYSNICEGSTTQFEIPEINNIVSVNWDFGDSLSPSNNSSLENPSHTFTSAGTYTVTLTLQTTSSTKTFTRNVTIVETPIANQPQDLTSCGNNSFSNFTLSNNNAEILGSQSSLNYQISYFSSYEDAENNENQLPDDYTNISNPQVIYARVQPVGSDQCFDITNFNLVVNNNPNLLSDGQASYCLNDFPNTITLSAGSLSPSSGMDYLWSTGETTESIEINSSGIYTVTVTDFYGCSSIRTITVTDSEIAVVNYTIEGNIGNNSIIINAVGSGSYVYALDNQFGTYQSSNVFQNITAGQHIIYVKDENECGISFATFSIIGYPNFFTPNGDGTNDSWNITGSFQTLKDLKIFDRFGKLLYYHKPYSLGWDGTYNGLEMPATDYWFSAKLIDDREFKGHFSLKR